ncbi:MAG: XisI protein [Chitinophagaceae bacterium]
MDNLTTNKKIVQALVEEIAAMTPTDEKSETQTIIDNERGHYVLFSVGWYNSNREYLPFVHIDVKDNGRIYIQHDGTDLKIALLLAEKGIDKKDIVLAYRSPQRRELMSDFAIN